MKVDINIKGVCDSRLKQVIWLVRKLELTVHQSIINCNRLVLSIEVNESGLKNLEQGIKTIIEDQEKVKIWKK